MNEIAGIMWALWALAAIALAEFLGYRAAIRETLETIAAAVGWLWRLVRNKPEPTWRDFYEIDDAPPPPLAPQRKRRPRRRQRRPPET